jgi:hypothetical protein
MQIVRTIVWVLLLVVYVAFSVANWEPRITVHIWQNLLLDTRLPAVVLVSFLLGLLPMWFLHRITAYYARRKIVSLQTAARTAAVTPAADPAPPAESPEALKSE